MSGRSTHLRLSINPAYCAIAFALVTVTMRGDTWAAPKDDGPTDRDPITISADYAHEWQEDGAVISVVRGHCRITQQDSTLSANRMVLWRTTRDGRDSIAVYLEDNVQLERPGSTLSRPTLFIDLVTRAGVNDQIRHRIAGMPTAKDALYERGVARRNVLLRGQILPAQYVTPGEAGNGPELRSIQVAPQTGGFRRIRILPRSVRPYTIESWESTAATPPEQIGVLTGGINLIVEGVDQFGTVDLAADRMVMWTQSVGVEQFSADTVQARDAPLQVYLEGHIVIRQGENVLTAERAFYDVREDRALMLDAELKAYIPQLRDRLRVRAERIQQLSQKSFHAQNAWTSTSSFGKPGYRIQANNIFLEQRFSEPWADPDTGLPVVEETPWITSLGNTFFLEDQPVVYAPYLSGSAENPNVPLRRATVKQDRVFGSQLMTVWDMHKLLGRESPPGVQWDLLADYLSDRGPGIGTAGKYRGRDAFGIPGVYSGQGRAYYIYDDGNDNLGLERRSLAPNDNSRGQILLRHRQDMPYQISVMGEIGFLSDRNFLEQYDENEFDEGKDYETLLYAKQQADNAAWTLLARPQVNDFANNTEWYPRGELFLLSQPLFDGPIIYSTRSSAGFATLNAADAPTDPTDIFTPLPYYAGANGASGAVMSSRHELSLPFSLGAFHFVPFVMGESAYWGEDFTGNSLSRYVGQAGLRGSIMFWKVMPYVQSRMFNLNGLAHKMVFDAEFAWTEANEPLGMIPQYNEFDDNAQERFRERFVTNTYGGVLPLAVDPRGYAVRTGAGSSVTAPYSELIDDQQVLRLGWRHRWQTKVGPPERLRIRDWMTLDLEASYFPDADRDNFGEDFGLLGSRYGWNFSDRTKLIAGSMYDLFDNGSELWNVGLLSQRSTRGSVYVGVRQVKNDSFDSQIMTASYSYAMSPKWISTAGTAFDLAENRNRGQSLTITRVGLDFLVHVGASFDQSKNNAGVAISIEPRFGPLDASSTRLSSLLGTGR